MSMHLRFLWIQKQDSVSIIFPSLDTHALFNLGYKSFFFAVNSVFTLFSKWVFVEIFVELVVLLNTLELPSVRGLLYISIIKLPRYHYRVRFASHFDLSRHMTECL